MKCPNCGEETEGRNHNGRGLRCTFCWALLPEPVKVEPPKPKRTHRPAAKSAK